jgi:toxin ParE1/3/4
VAHEVGWAESALAGLTEAVEYIARDSPSYAASLAVRADQAALSLSEFPSRGRIVREYRDHAVRELIVSSKYRLIYRIAANKVSVIAFVHTARDLAALVEGTTS